MSYVVLSTDASGERSIDEAESLDAALQQVEHLRNDDGISDVRVLREVPIEVKTYYKVVALEQEHPEPAATAPSVPPPPASGSADGGANGSGLSVTEHPLDDVAATSERPAPADPQGEAGADFFTPPPVRSREDDADGDDAVSSPSERRTSLFGRS